MPPPYGNLVLWSTDWTHGVWVLEQVLVEPDVAISPDGVLDAARLTVDSTTDFRRIRQFYPYDASYLGEVVTHSVYAKADTVDSVTLIQRDDNSSRHRAIFDLTAESATVNLGALSAGIAAVAGSPGWYRCWIECEPLTLTDVEWGLYPGVYNDQTLGESVFVWGPQSNFGTTPTNYIRTTDAQRLGSGLLARRRTAMGALR